MVRRGWIVWLAAWAALVLPWERCHAGCHDQMRPVGEKHDCHGPDCPQKPALPDETGDECDHEIVQFTSLAPVIWSGLDLILVEVPYSLDPATEIPESREAEPASHPPFHPGETVVLLL
ncbi:MAG: hypothetical protein ACYSUN_00685 [Planctomycetota bacterium]|jgi:hypothetical protein